MFKEAQTLKLKEEHAGADLPKEITISKVDGDTIIINSEEGTVESTAAILESFYELKEELTLESLPRTVISTLDEVIRLFDAYASSSEPAIGLQVKTKLMSLKASAAKISGEKASGLAALGRKLS